MRLGPDLGRDLHRGMWDSDDRARARAHHRARGGAPGEALMCPGCGDERGWGDVCPSCGRELVCASLVEAESAKVTVQRPLWKGVVVALASGLATISLTVLLIHELDSHTRELSGIQGKLAEAVLAMLIFGVPWLVFATVTLVSRVRDTGWSWAGRLRGGDHQGSLARPVGFLLTALAAIASLVALIGWLAPTAEGRVYASTFTFMGWLIPLFFLVGGHWMGVAKVRRAVKAVEEAERASGDTTPPAVARAQGTLTRRAPQWVNGSMVAPRRGRSGDMPI